ncbi:MAG: allantoinase [Polaribacter sp.]|jgi:allantoinase
MLSIKGLHSQRCWIDGKFKEATILIDSDKILEIRLGKLHSSSSEIMDVGRAVVMPGAIDVHTHINQPGRTEWEGFETATKAAAAGGITTLVDMPLNSSPVTTNVKAFKEKMKAGQLSNRYVNCGLYGGLVPDNLEDLEDLIECGVLGIKCFLTHSGINDFPNVGKKELDAAMPIIAKYNIPMLAHCELTDKPADATDEERLPGSYRQYLASRPRRWENEAVDLMIDLCETHKCQTHIVHVASSDALASIENAKEKGLHLTAETCPHYMYFNAEGIPDNNTLYKCAPPIREEENNQKLKAAFKSGVLDFIGSDHSPAPPELKEIESGNLMKAWGGISGLQYLISASWTSLKGLLTLDEFIPLLTENPAKYLGIQNQKGYLKKGMDADFTIWSPEETFEVTISENQHKHKITPYTGEILFGKIESTFVNGVQVFNGVVLNKQPGKWILKKQ